MLNKVYISNIISDKLVTDGRPEITIIGLREIVSDRQLEGCSIEKRVVTILGPYQYESVQEKGYYIYNDEIPNALT